MRGGNRIGIAAAALFAAGCATSSPTPASVGRILTYQRSNSDGSEAETIHVYRAASNRLEVAKMRERCTNAAFVTAELDLARGHPLRLTGGRLRPEARHADFAELRYDPASRTIRARAALPGGEAAQSVAIADEPWYLYDFDLADLSAATSARADPRASFSFGLALVWLGDDPREFLRYLGRADARFAGETRFRGQRALRFEAGGPAFGDKGGTLLLDARDGHVLAADFGLPNHAEYRDFRLRLTASRRGGPAAWKRLLARHFEGCPAAVD
jgi:hypothetical protein